MQVILETDRAGGNGFVQLEGEVIDLPEREAYRLIQRGQARAVQPECAAVAPSENEMRLQPRPKRK